MLDTDNLSDNYQDDLGDDLIPTVDIDQLAAESDAEIPPSEMSAFTAEEFAAEMLKVAISYIGVTRSTNLPQVAKFLGLFGLPTKMDGKWVPFCAAGISFASAKAYCNLSNIPYTADNAIAVFRKVLPTLKHLYFLPSPSTQVIKADAVSRGTWIPGSNGHSTVKPGFLLEYNWAGGSTPEHIGIVEKLGTSTVATVEFNTSDADNSNGGAVNRRTRAYTPVVGYVKLY